MENEKEQYLEKVKIVWFGFKADKVRDLKHTKKVLEDVFRMMFGESLCYEQEGYMKKENEENEEI